MYVTIKHLNCVNGIEYRQNDKNVIKIPISTPCFRTYLKTLPSYAIRRSILKVFAYNNQVDCIVFTVYT